MIHYLSVLFSMSVCLTLAIPSSSLSAMIHASLLAKQNLAETKT